MQMRCSASAQVGVATLSGSLNVVHVDRFRSEFKEWIDDNSGVKNIVFDFTEVDMVDSAGLGALITALKLVRARSGTLKLAGLTRRVHLVFQVTRTDRLFEIHKSVDEALAEME